MNRWLNGFLVGLAALGVVGVRPVMASPIGFGDALSYEQLRGDIRQILHVLDQDFWKGVEAVGDEMDPEYEPGGRKNLSGITLGGVGVTMLTAGIINERATRVFPNLPREQAVAQYRRVLGFRIKKAMAKVAPRKSKFYENFARASTKLGDVSQIEDEAIVAGKMIPRWASRTLLLGGGAVLTAAALMYLLMVDFDYTKGRKAPPVEPGECKWDDGSSNLLSLKTVFGPGRSEDEIVEITARSPDLTREVHHLASALRDVM